LSPADKTGGSGMSKIQLSVDGLLQRLQQEGFRPIQFEANIATGRKYRLGDYILVCMPYGQVTLFKKQDYDHAMKARSVCDRVADELVYNQDGMDRMLAAIRQHVKIIPVEEPKENTEHQPATWLDKWGYQKVKK